MARRIRTAKKLGTRHDLNYFKRVTASARWRKTLSIALPVAFLVWLFSSGVMGNQLPYSSGPVAKAHSVFAKQCSSCHSNMVNGVKMVGFKNNATDEACLNCHQAPAHQKNQVFTPTCASCHVEHRGIVQLTHTADSNCVRCHGNLVTASGTPRFERTIFNFDSKHPEFAAVRNGARDPGTIAFNHHVHLRADIAGPKGQVRLVCDDCHRTPGDANRTWRFAENQKQPQPQLPAEAPDILRPSSGRAYMLPVTYARTCAACHTLQFDAASAESVPHEKPELVHAFVVEKLAKSLAGKSLKPVAFERPIPGVRSETTSGGSSLQARLRDDERLLWRKTCKQCHAVNFENASASLPKIAPSNITKIWLKNAVFSHYPHQSLSCESCHRTTATSQETSDVLLPGIATCQQCHKSAGASNGAENGCFLCHQYHDWKQAGPRNPAHGMELTAIPATGKWF